MNRNLPLSHCMGNPIRDQNVLISQIITDYKEVKERWERIQKGTVGNAEIEKILQTIAWVKTGITTLRRAQKDRIESIIWGKIDEIENEIIRVQDKIRIRINGS